jgi:hypothetical protein
MGSAFWSCSCYVGSVGDMSVDTVLKYIKLGLDQEQNKYKVLLIFPLSFFTSSGEPFPCIWTTIRFGNLLPVDERCISTTANTTSLMLPIA